MTANHFAVPMPTVRAIGLAAAFTGHLAGHPCVLLALFALHAAMLAMPMLALDATHANRATPIAGHGQRMPYLAMRASGISGWWTLPAQDILRVGHGLKVSRINARPIATQVVQT